MKLDLKKLAPCLLLAGVFLVAAPVLPAQSPDGTLMTLDIRNGDQNGKLVVNETTVAFESLSDGKRSRTWPYAEVRELTKRGSKEMRVRPFKGDRYDFQFKDRGQRDKVYDMLAQKVVAARQNKK